MKCAIWDVDGTFWPETLLEHAGDALPSPAPRALETVRALRGRGIVSAIATRNSADVRTRILSTSWADEFVSVRASWEPKPSVIVALADELRLAISDLVYVDDDPFQRADVENSLPGLRAMSLTELARAPILARAAAPVTAEAQRRTQLYRDEARRVAAADAAGGPRDDFLRASDIVLTLRRAGAHDVPRLAELVRRTNRYNSTGVRCTDDEIADLVCQRHVTVADLRDRFGEYGLIGATVATLEDKTYDVQLLVMSCRVSGRGCTRGLIASVCREGRDLGAARLRVGVVPSEHNAPLRLALRSSGLHGYRSKDGRVWFEHDLRQDGPYAPDWLHVSQC